MLYTHEDLRLDTQHPDKKQTEQCKSITPALEICGRRGWLSSIAYLANSRSEKDSSKTGEWNLRDGGHGMCTGTHTGTHTHTFILAHIYVCMHRPSYACAPKYT